MSKRINHFKRALKSGTLQIGLWSGLSSNVTVEVLANAGFDWLLLDMEHSPNELTMVHSQLQAIAQGTAQPIVRPPWNDTVVIKRLLDVGAQTLLIPFVQNAEEARQAVAATRYPPHGVRGFSTAARASDYGRVADYWATSSEDICVLLQVETPEAIANIDENAIHAFPGGGVGDAWGAGETALVKVITGATLTLGALIGVLAAVLGSLFARPAMHALGTPLDVLDDAVGYAQVMMLIMPLLLVFILYTQLLRGVSDTVSPLLALMVSTVVGLLLTPALIRGWLGLAPMGIQSAAYAGLVANAVAMLFLVLRLRHKDHVMAPDRALLAECALDVGEGHGAAVKTHVQ
eukprot:gene32140-39694_t